MTNGASHGQGFEILDSLRRRKINEISLELGANHHAFGSFIRGDLPHGLYMFVLVSSTECGFVYVRRINRRLHGEQEIVASDSLLVFAQRNAARGLKLL